MKREEVIKKIEAVFSKEKIADFVTDVVSDIEKDVRDTFLTDMHDEIELIADIIVPRAEKQVAGYQTFYKSLRFFKAGDICYAYETSDYYPSIFRMPEGYNGEDCIRCDYIVLKTDGSANEVSIQDCFCIDADMVFRLATDEEVKIFNDLIK